MEVGADWDCEKCVVVFDKDSKRRRAEVKRTPASVAAFVESCGEAIVVGIEPGDRGWERLWSNAGAEVRVFDAQKAKSYAKSLNSSGASDDRRSAEALLGMLRSCEHQGQENQLLSGELRALSQMLELMDKLSQDVVRDSNRLFSHLRQVHPALALIAGRSKVSQWFLRTLDAAPTPRAWNELSEDERRACLKGSAQEKREQLTQALGENWNLVRDDEEEAMRVLIRMLASRLAASLKAHHHIQRTLAKLQKSSSQTEPPSMRGLGPFVGSAVVLGLHSKGGRDRLAVALCNAPVTNRSGTHGDRSPLVKTRRAASSTMRKAGHLLGFQMVRNHDVARAQYAFYRSRGKSGVDAYHRVGRSFSRIITALHRDGSEFDEKRYVAALKSKGVEWAMEL